MLKDQRVTRPTAAKTREAIFNIIASRLMIEDLIILDVFAGTGAMGLEALSRGGAKAFFIERSPDSHNIITENINLLGLQNQAAVLLRDAGRPGKPPASMPQVDLVFIDPPYDKNDRNATNKGLGLLAMQALSKNGWLAAEALIIFESNTPEITQANIPQGFTHLLQKNYGKTNISVFLYQAAGVRND